MRAEASSDVAQPHFNMIVASGCGCTIGAAWVCLDMFLILFLMITNRYSCILDYRTLYARDMVIQDTVGTSYKKPI